MSEASKDMGINAGLPPARPDSESVPGPGPAPSPSWPARRWALLALTHLIAASLGALGAAALLKPMGPGNAKVTLETFNTIQPNMQHVEVQGLFGDKGAPDISQGGDGEVKWEGRPDMRADPTRGGPTIGVTFLHGKVINKRATNLK